MAENNKFKKPVLPGRDAQIEISPELQEGIQKIGDSIAKAFGRDGRKVLRTDREGNVDIGATVRAFTGAFNKSSGAILDEAAKALKAGTTISGDLGGVKFNADIPPQPTGGIIEGQRRSSAALGELGEVIASIGQRAQEAMKPRHSNLDEGGLPMISTPGPKQDSMRFVNMAVNMAVGTFILTDHARGMKEGTIKEGQGLLSSDDLLDYGLNMRTKSLEVGARFTQADPTLTFLALSKLQESGMFKGRDHETAQQALDFLKSHNDLSDLQSDRMRSAQEHFGSIPGIVAGLQKEMETPAMQPDATDNRRTQTFDALKR